MVEGACSSSAVSFRPHCLDNRERFPTDKIPIIAALSSCTFDAPYVSVWSIIQKLLYGFVAMADHNIDDNDSLT